MRPGANAIATGILLLSLVSTTNHPHAATTEYRGLVESFFSLVSEGLPGRAIDSLYETSPYLKGYQSQFEHVRRQFVGSADAVGAYHTYDVIIEKNLADRWAFMWVMGVYERAPVFFEFTFYKSEKSWRLQNFLFGSGKEIEDEVRLQAKIRIWPFATESGGTN